MAKLDAAARVALLCLMTGMASCAAPPQKPAAASAPTASASWDSAEFGFSWTLGDGWEYIPPEDIGIKRESLAFEIAMAQKVGSKLPWTQLVVTDLISVPQGEEREPKPTDFEDLVESGKRPILEREGEILAARRVRMAGREAVEVTGRVGELQLSSRAFYEGRLHFEFRCVSARDQGVWPCESAYARFELRNAAPKPPEGETPRILHLRDARFGVEFDAPSDKWLAIGPRSGLGGGQVVWLWIHGKREIDVHVLDMSFLPNPPGAEEMTARMLDAQPEDSVVSVEESTLAGLPCDRLVIDRADGVKTDIFMLTHGTASYSLLISGPKRDPRLIEQAKLGFRLTRPRRTY